MLCVKYISVKKKKLVEWMKELPKKVPLGQGNQDMQALPAGLFSGGQRKSFPY